MRRLIPFVTAVGLALASWGYVNATADPIVRRLDLHVAALPTGTVPINIVLISDIHVAAPDMTPQRLRRIVGQINRLRPDVVLIAGDLTSHKFLSFGRYNWPETVAPYRGIHAKLGVIAVLGNHDHWGDAAKAKKALANVGVRVLTNDAAEVGPLALGGLDDPASGHANVPATIARMRKLRGLRVLVSHSPDPFPGLPADIGLMLAGHTHCGQIKLPIVGRMATNSQYGDHYACGVIRENGRILVVSAGLGTSIAPIRFGAPPDMWFIRISGLIDRP